MHPSRIFLILLAMIATPSVHSQTLEEKRVTEAVEKLKQAMLSGDPKALDHIAADNLSYWHSSGKHEDKAAFIESLVTGQSDFVSIDLSDQTLKVSGDVATVHHILTAKTNDGGQPGEVKIGILLVFQKLENEWKLFARQAFKLPS